MMDERKYKPMSHTLDYINANFISIKKEDRTRYSEILIDVLNQFKNKMMKVNTLYNALNDGDIIYAGSTYDNIKVGKPNEFDLNVPLKLPINYKTELMIENVNKEPGFTKVAFTSEGWERLQKHNNWTIYSKMLGWVNEERQLLQDKFLQWMQGVVISTIEEIKKESKNPIPVIVTKTNKSIEITSTTSGPALTLHLKYQDILIDVDLVPVIRFNNSPEENHWPKSPVKPLPSKCIKRTFVAVPKPKRNSNGGAIIPKNPSWRLSFHEQEYELLAGTGELKNCLRQIKKLRDNNPHLKCVASYWIKTLFIWENENPGNADLWRKPKGVIFMHMLNKFLEYIKVGKIPFYWDPNHNLLSPINKNKLNGIREVLQGIITKIDKNVEGNPAYIAEILLNAEELARFKEGYVPVASSSGSVNGNLAGNASTDKDKNLQRNGSGSGNTCDSSVTGNTSRSLTTSSGVSTNNSNDNEKILAMLKTIQGLLSKNDSAMESMKTEIQNLNANLIDLKYELSEVKDELKIWKKSTKIDEGFNVPRQLDLLQPEILNSKLLDLE